MFGAEALNRTLEKEDDGAEYAHDHTEVLVLWKQK